MRFVFLSHTAELGPFRVGSHHLSRALARRGHRVLHISTPLSLASLARYRTRPDIRPRVRAALSKPQMDEDGRRLSIVPVSLIPVQATAARADNTALRTVWPRLRPLAVGHLGGPPDVLLVDQPLMAGAWKAFPEAKVIYRPTDRYESGVSAAAQSLVLSRADGVVATSEVVLRELGSLRVPSLVLPNGVDFDRFGEPGAGGARAGAVYVGAIDERFDWDWLAVIASNLPGLPFTIVGKVVNKPPELPANVVLTGPVSYDDIPELLRRHRVGLMPFAQSPLNDGRSPMKLYEYLATGLFVLSTQVETVAAAQAPGVVVATDPQEALGSLEHLLTDDNPNGNVPGKSVAKAMDWASKAGELEVFCLSVL